MPAAMWWASCRIRSAAWLRPRAATTAPVSFTRWRLDMRRSTLWMCALLTIATLGCKQVNEQWEKVKAKIEAARQRTKPAPPTPPQPAPAEPRSEEHTSELQSRGHLVCRLLLEKKKYHIV